MNHHRSMYHGSTSSATTLSTFPALSSQQAHISGNWLFDEDINNEISTIPTQLDDLWTRGCSGLDSLVNLDPTSESSTLDRFYDDDDFSVKGFSPANLLLRISPSSLQTLDEPSRPKITQILDQLTGDANPLFTPLTNKDNPANNPSYFTCSLGSWKEEFDACYREYLSPKLYFSRARLEAAIAEISRSESREDTASLTALVSAALAVGLALRDDAEQQSFKPVKTRAFTKAEAFSIALSQSYFIDCRRPSINALYASQPQQSL
ncbi:uncharacterized protein LY89DRAFT_251706 [Mollisia scopiformis]|uniref:Uncharacterized protein n=1 Tax=Mollisia scopiformis TaxID=149040 RepID=A0A194WSC9_MOLSC|nr:uncharacterized protein LY89DRAFT_251706 [Mollisia scopiformis]KUJ10871.1 hypothetical protein LY89DRAFT_251706 [Mollisia scopiformis]